MVERDVDQIRRDLETRGISRELAPALARRLAEATEQLSGEAYDAVLTGVAIAYGRGHRNTADAAGGEAGIEEVQRLMGAFTVELRKLEEALETLAAYVTRMRTQTRAKQPDRVLH